MKNCILFAIFFISCLSLNAALENRPYKKMKTSVVIPCIDKHFCFIKNLLKEYAKQSVIPDEIVISLQRYQNIDKKKIQRIKKKKWPFQVKIVYSDYGSIGGNRNKGCQSSTGELLILNDADDIPHPRRVEMIKHLFENFKVDSIIHSYIFSNESFPAYTIADAENRCLYYSDLGAISMERWHNGNIAITREVFNNHKWIVDQEYGEDICFNISVCQKFKHTVALEESLMMYRLEYSSLNNKAPLH